VRGEALWWGVFGVAWERLGELEVVATWSLGAWSRRFVCALA
jgi:hypothetical protein